MNYAIIGIAIGSIAIAIVFVFLWIISLRTTKELAEKTTRSIAGEPAFPVELPHAGSVQTIAQNFNQLVLKNQEYAHDYKQFEHIKKENEIIEKKFIQSERSTQGVKLFAEMGRQITQSLSIDEITKKLFDLINSACSIDDIEIYITDNKILYSRNMHSGVQNSEVSVSQESIQHWVLKHRRIAVLGNNQRDYTRYTSIPVELNQGVSPVSVICVELVIGEKNIGILTISSTQEDVFDSDIKDYIHSLASYAAIAIYNALLYTDIGKQKELVEIEKTKSDGLLLNILPREIADELKETGKARARKFDNVTVVFSDFKSFTKIAEALTPEELVSELDECFSAFDDISAKYGIEKIKTIGDAYLAVCGLPLANKKHAEVVVRAALEMQLYLKNKNIERKALGKPLFYARVGVHSGSVVAGVVGKSKFAFDIWGDTVNTAARMEQSGEIEKVNLSGDTWNLVQTLFKGTYRGKIEAKNKGSMDMYFVDNL